MRVDCDICKKALFKKATGGFWMLSERKSKCFFLTQRQCVCISKVSEENQCAIPATKLEISPIRILWSDSNCGFEKPKNPNSRSLVSHFVAQQGEVAAENSLDVVSLFSDVQILQHLQTDKNKGGYFDILHRSTAWGHRNLHSNRAARPPMLICMYCTQPLEPDYSVTSHHSDQTCTPSQ